MTQSIEAILAERAKTHGDFTVHASITQRLKCVARQPNPKLTDVHREAIDMVLHKIGRIIAGDPNIRDHWDDIAGYAKLAADRCQQSA